MKSNRVLLKLSNVTEEKKLEEKELIKFYRPFSKREMDILIKVRKEYQGFLTATEIAEFLGVARNSVYSYQEQCPVRNISKDSNRLYFLPHSVLIIAREMNITL